MIKRVAKGAWIRVWMRLAGTGRFGRIAAWLAAQAVPPFFSRARLAQLYPKGFTAPSAQIHHSALRRGSHTLIDDRVLIYQSRPGGSVTLHDRVNILRDSILETGNGGHIEIGPETVLQPRCLLCAHVRSIRIGRRVQIAAGCAFYSYDHGIAPATPIWDQPLTSRGDIDIGDDAWLGYGVIVLSGVRIGAGAVVGAGSVVTREVPDGAVAVGNPARVIRMRGDLAPAARRATAAFRR